MNAKIDPQRLLTTLDVAGRLVEECKIHLNDDGIQIRAVDPANVGMTDVRLDAAAFESYEVNGDAGVIGTSLDPIVDTANMASGDEPVQLRLDNETKMLHVTVEQMERTIALIDPDSIREEPDIPDLDLPAEVTVEGRDIDRGIDAADMVGDHVTFGVDEREREFVVTAEGDTDDVSLELAEEDLIDLTPGEAASIFSLDYLKDMVKSVPKDAEVTMELGEEFPVKMEFTLAEGDGNAMYMLAPRLESD